MAQPKSKRLLTEQQAEATYLQIDNLDIDERSAEVLSVPSTEARKVLSKAYVERDEFAGLMGWYAAYAARDTRAVKVAVVSEFEGVGSTAPHHRNRWHRLLELALRDGQPGGPGFIPAAYATAGMTDATTRTGGTITEQIGSEGAGGRYVNVSEGGVLGFPSETITSFRVWYYKGDFFSGDGQIKVDGGATVATISSANGGAGPLDALTWPALPAAPHPVTAGAHVVSVTGPTTSSSSQIAAIELFNGDENKGVHVYDLGRSGLSFADLNSSQWNKSLWTGYIPAIVPDLTILMLGGAHYGNAVDFTELDIVNTMLKVDQMVHTTFSPVLLVAPPRPVKSPAGDPNVWADYVARMRNEADLRPDRVAFLDMQEHWPAVVAGGFNSLGLMHETNFPYNPSQAGQRRFVDVLKKVLV